jgi:hypothetical protein
MKRITHACLWFTLLLFGCGTEPVYTAFDATLVSPNGPEGAAVFELAGEYHNVQLTGSGQVFAHADRGVTRVVIVLDTPGEIGFTVQLDVAGELPQTQVVEVADGSNQIRASVSEYRLELEGVVR